METQLTAPQQKVLDYVTKHGEVEVGHLGKRGLDVRAANNLVKSGVLSLTGGVYRLKAQGKHAEKAEKPVEEAVRKDESAATEEERPSEAPVAKEDPAAPEVPEASSEAPARRFDVGARVRLLSGRFEGRMGVVRKLPRDHADFAYVQLDPTARERKEKVELVNMNTLEAVQSGESEARPASEAAPKAKNEKTAKAAKPVVVVNPSEKCLCGCGAELGPKRRFALGHDAKLHSLVLKVFRGQVDKSALPTAEATLEYLRGAPWMKDEIRTAIGLV